jgi:ketosteroid isomerase-like protein
MSQENVEIVLRGLEAFMRRDVEALIELSGPHFEMHLSGVVGEPVRYQGADGIRQYFRDTGKDWASLGFDVQDVRDLGDRVLVSGTQRARGRASGAEVESAGAFVVAFDLGSVTGIRFFADPAEALRAVGLAE